MNWLVTTAPPRTSRNIELQVVVYRVVHQSEEVGIAQALAKHLVLFHHEPANNDATLERLLNETRRFEELTREGPVLMVSSAYDGMEIEL